MLRTLGSIALLTIGLLAPAMAQQEVVDINDWPTAGGLPVYPVTGVYLAQLTSEDDKAGPFTTPGLFLVNEDGCVSFTGNMTDLPLSLWLGDHDDLRGVWKKTDSGYGFRMLYITYDPYRVIRATANVRFDRRHTEAKGTLTLELFHPLQLLDPPDPNAVVEPRDGIVEASLMLRRLVAE